MLRVIRTETPAKRMEGRKGNGLLLWVQRWLQVRVSPPQRSLRVLESISLGNQRSVTLLECDGRRYLAGVGGVQILLAAAEQSGSAEVAR